ncbi:MAG: TIGR04563 family protein [Myxococcales bacterium]|nr:TIGR04563 family protein [Myxococcales bacterium]MCB9707910.1 TIGR04563 family protein [Myxococcales bacterium]
MAGSDKRKQSLYFPETMLQDIQREATRLDRSLSWIVQRCVKLGLSEIRKLPSVNEVPGAEDEKEELEQQRHAANH